VIHLWGLGVRAVGRACRLYALHLKHYDFDNTKILDCMFL